VSDVGDSAITAVSLFSGIGGLDLGCERAFRRMGYGWRTAAYVEREAYAVALLEQRISEGRLPFAPIWTDVRTFPARRFRGVVDLVLGGFPCTDLSVAGKQAGITGERSGLWFEFARIVREAQPRWVVIENVPPVLAAGNAGAVLGDLAEAGFDARWTTLRASDVGAPHRRQRVFILADRERLRKQQREGTEREIRRRATDGGEAVANGAVGNASGAGLEGSATQQVRPWDSRRTTERAGHSIPDWPPGPNDAAGWRWVLERWPELAPAVGKSEDEHGEVRGGGNGQGSRAQQHRGPSGDDAERDKGETPAQPADGGVADDGKGRYRVDRLRALGNAVVPAQAEAALMELMRETQ